MERIPMKSKKLKEADPRKIDKVEDHKERLEEIRWN